AETLTRQHGIDHLKGLVDLFADLCASQNNLAAHKDEQDNLRLHHAVDEAGEELRFVGAKVVMLARQAFEADRELDVARADNVLDLKVRKLGVEAELLDDAGVFARRELRVVLRLGTSDDHLARREDQGGRLGLADAHDDGCKTLESQSVSAIVSKKKKRRHVG